MSTCNRLDLETLRSQPFMLKIPLEHLVDKLEMVQVHFTPCPEGTWHQKTFELMNSIHGTKMMMFHNLSDIALDPSQRGESNAKLRMWPTINL